jgi:hypothetical protein
MFTADNSTALNQAAPTDVRAGVAYGIGNSQTGRLTVPARGSVALSVNYGPSMPFTATRSGTTATATLAYSYPLVVGDEFTVTGASNSEWNSTYTIASVVSGTSVTFTVPNTHSSTAGVGALMQTTGTAVLDPTAVASAVWGAATRTITGGLVDTATTLTNAPTVPTPSQIASQVRTELSTELSRLDVATSTRAVAADIPTSDISAIKSKTDALPSDPADQSLVEAAIFGLTIPSVVQIRTELDSNSTKLANLDATISSRSTLTTGDLPSVPSAASVASAVRTELTELSNLDASVSSRLASASYTAPANSDISAIKSKTDNLPASPAAVSDIPTTAQISAAVEGSLLNESDGQQILNAIVGAIGNTNLSEVSLVAAVRADLERNGGKLINLDAAISSRLAAADYSAPTSAPTAASVATAVWGAATKEITGGTVTTLTNSPDVPTESEIAAQVRTELSVELGRIDAAISSRLAPSGTLATVTTLTNAPTVPTAAAIADEVRVELATELARIDAPVSGATAPSAATVATAVRSELATELARVDQAVSTRLAGSAYTAPANSDVAAIKVKTDALVVERLNNCATTAIVGNLLAQANS